MAIIADNISANTWYHALPILKYIDNYLSVLTAQSDVYLAGPNSFESSDHWPLMMSEDY